MDGLGLQLSQRSIEDIEARHNRNLEAYLRTQQFKGNQHYRGGVFRDVIIESDYDPLVANQSAIKVLRLLMHHDMFMIAKTLPVGMRTRAPATHPLVSGNRGPLSYRTKDAIDHGAFKYDWKDRDSYLEPSKLLLS